MASPAPSEIAPHVHHPNADSSVEFKGMAAFEAKGDVKPFAYNPPQLASNFVEVAIECCGICGSDIHTIDSGWYKAKYPLIVGHEIVGTITAAGSDVKNVKVGDRVGIGAQCGSCLDGSAPQKCYECRHGKVQHCSVERTLTYGTQRPDGQVTQGGYADRIRCASTFTIPIPDAIPSVYAAPLMCAGITVYAPLSRFLTRPAMRVGVIGIGGLGHLALQFASKMQGGSAVVTAISHNAKKRDESLIMGATKFLDTSVGKDMYGAARSFDLIICTANGQAQDYNQWLGLMAFDGVFCCVGLPETPLDIEAFSLLSARVTLCASLIGTPAEIVEMLDFAAKHEVRPIIERLPMSDTQKGINKVRDGSVRFRVVLENQTMP